MSPPAGIGKYRVEREIGRGGIGVVYLAHDAELSRQVAIKVLRGDFDEQGRERFLRGAQVLARLRHPNIVTVHEFGHSDGQPFIVMEYIVGESLRAIIDQRPMLPLSRKLEIIDGICAGMTYAHREQVVHRDLKPENIMIEADSGTPRIVDFDLSRSLRTNASRLTQGVGTFHYMAPEQFLGQTDSRSDIFSVGAVAYELLSYATAFEGDAATVMHKIFTEKPRSLAQRVAGMDRRLVKIVHRALAKKPRTRYQTLEAMRADIAVVHSSLNPTVVLELVESVGGAIRWRRTAWAGGISIGFMLLAWILVGSLANRAESIAPQSVRADNDRSEQPPTQPPAVAEDSRSQPFTPLVVSKTAPGAPLPSNDFTKVGTATAAGSARYELRQYIPLEGPQHALALSAVPRLLARVADFETKIRVSELTTGREVRSLVGGALLLSLTQDGKRLAAVQPFDKGKTRSVLKLWDVATGQEIQTVDLRDSVVRSLRFNASGQSIAIATGQGVRLVDVDSGIQVRDLASALPLGDGGLGFSPDDRVLAVVSLNGTIQLWNVRTGQPEQTFPYSADGRTQSESSQVAFSADGSKLAVASVSHGVTVWDLASGPGSPEAIFRRTEGVSAVAFSPDGAWLLSGDTDARVTFWDLIHRQYFQGLGEASSAPGKGRGGAVTSLLFSPDGSLLVAGTASGAGLWQRIP